MCCFLIQVLASFSEEPIYLHRLQCSVVYELDSNQIFFKFLRLYSCCMFCHPQGFCNSTILWREGTVSPWQTQTVQTAQLRMTFPSRCPHLPTCLRARRSLQPQSPLGLVITGRTYVWSSMVPSRRVSQTPWMIHPWGLAPRRHQWTHCTIMALTTSPTNRNATGWSSLGGECLQLQLLFISYVIILTFLFSSHATGHTD